MIAFLFTWNITCTVIISSFTQSCPTLWDPMDCSLPGSEEPLSAWNLPGKSPGVVAISFSRESSQPRDLTRVSHTAGRRFTVWATRKTHLLDTLNKITLFPRALYTWICVDNNNNSKHYVASFIGHFSIAHLTHTTIIWAECYSIPQFTVRKMKYQEIKYVERHL